MKRILIAGVLAGALLRPAPARACSVVGPSPLEIDDALAADDTTPPSVPVITSAVWQGTGGLSTCSDVRTLAVAVEATDDQTAPEGIGYELELDPAPEWFGPQAPMLARDGFVSLVFADESLGDVSVRARAVDPAGNRSELSEPYPVEIDVAWGCAAAPGGGSGAAALTLLLGLGLGVRHRRRPSTAP